MCTRNKTAQHVYVQDNTDALEIRLKTEPSFIHVSYYFVVFMLLVFYKHITRMCSSCIYKSVQPELLNTAIGKQSTVNFPIGINTCTPVSFEERLKLIWRPMNEFMSA